MSLTGYCDLRITLVVILLLSHAVLKAEAADYFPLRVGNSWTYSPSYGAKGDRIDTIVGTETVNGTLTRIWNRQEAPDDNYNEKRWYAKEDSFLRGYKIWSNGGIDPAVNINPPWRVLKLNPVVGETWEFEIDIASIHYKVTYYVRSTTDSITVAAGSFSNCIRVQELGEITENGTTEYEYEETIYAPDVGPIIYRDYTENWTNVTFSQELVSFSISTETGKTIPGIPLLLLDDGSTVPVPGDWSGSADFGTLTFFVNSTSTGISTFGYNFSDFLCGGVLRNGGTTIVRDPPWPIINNQFSVEINSDPNFEMTITGMFENSGRRATGTWEAVSYGTRCSGTWNAAR